MTGPAGDPPPLDPIYASCPGCRAVDTPRDEDGARTLCSSCAACRERAVGRLRDMARVVEDLSSELGGADWVPERAWPLVDVALAGASGLLRLAADALREVGP